METAVLTREAAPKTEKKRDFGLDLIRALAIFGVMLVHAASDGYHTPVGSGSWWGSILWSLPCRRNVALFLMCSGAILLQPEKPLPLKKLFFHNMLRLLVSLLFWAMFYKVTALLDTHALNGASLWQAFKETLLFKHESHLYYMHIMLLVYLWLPVTRIITEKADRKQLRYVLAVWFLCGILYPTLRLFWPFRLMYGIPAQWVLNMAYASIGYGLLGWYLRKYPISLKWGIGLTAAGLVWLFAGTVLLSFRNGSSYTGLIEEMTVGPCLLGAGIYSLCLRAKDAPNRAVGLVVNQLSRGSLCIYAVHIWVMKQFPRCLEWGNLPTILSIPVQAICVFACSWAIYFVLSKIPVVKKWIV